ncbi:MAG: hypothetical protein A4E58_00103 [Syntrophorhabdus sp. PtaB.Bin006]|nr:MAG: hypothetical protein A4E58_00103 [Syntrophorhabdus sp. PtaB.Bin006]
MECKIVYIISLIRTTITIPYLSLLAEIEISVQQLCEYPS